MFSTLHDLAKRATLMITVAAEGDDQLRVNVTPMPADTKAKSNLPQPLSLLATPTEFDADFVAALSTWQAPKRSLIQQAQDAAGGAPAAAAPALPVPKPESKPEKPGRKPRAGKGGDDDKKDGAQLAAAAGGMGAEQAGGADEVIAQPDGAVAVVNQVGDGAGAAPDAPAGEEPVDKFTLDLF